MNREAYLFCLIEMLSGAPGYTTATLRNYLAPLETQFGDRFDPVRALTDLQKCIEILRAELIKANIT
jgi:hypothetical protein